MILQEVAHLLDPKSFILRDADVLDSIVLDPLLPSTEKILEEVDGDRVVAWQVRVAVYREETKRVYGNQSIEKGPTCKSPACSCTWPGTR